MVFLVMMMLILAGVVAAVALPALRDGKGDPGSAPDAGKPDTRPASPRPESLEGVLVRQLFGTEINLRQYQHAMAALAARDADRHPLSVPSDGGPPDGGPSDAATNR